MFTVILSREVLNGVKSSITLNVSGQSEDEAVAKAETMLNGWRAMKVSKGTTALDS